jgi:hypothetical protein
VPSRRSYLAVCCGAATTALAGCVGDVVHAPNAYCQLKAISVEWTHRGRRNQDEVLWVIASRPERHLDVTAAAEFAGVASDPSAVSVTDERRRDLDRTFLNVQYVLGFCGSAFGDRGDDRETGCRNTDAASRSDFNRVQAGDDARITLVDDAFTVHDVDERSTDGWTVEYDERDFSELHAENGVPLD